MPPKRKLAENDSKETTRSTRSSTRGKPTTAKSNLGENMPAKQATRRGTKGSVTQVQGGHHEDSAEQQPAKKLKTTKSTGKGRKQTKTNAAHDDYQESGATRQTLVDDEDHKVKQSKSSSTTHVEAAAANLKATESPPKGTAISSDKEPYTPQRALTLFGTYADSDEPDVIGPEGFEKLCSDSGLSMEGSVPLILAWQMEAKEMAKISKEEWVNGTGALRISSSQQLSTALTDLENLLIYGQPPVKKHKTDPYDRTKYTIYASDPKDAFHKLYLYCFMLVKPPSSKNIEMETAVAFWSVLLGPKYPLMKEVLEFINEKGAYRAANKDLWNMMLEFCETVNPNLDNFEADGAWPTLLDEFASWKTTKLET